MLKSLTYMGFRRFPLTFTGVPELDKASRPVGFERELAQLMDVVDKLLNTSLNENLLVVIVGEYGWGKTELLDYFVSIVAEKYNGKIEIARVPLTFNLSSQHIVNVIRRRSGKPLILIIDEADEIVRALSLRKVAGDGKDVERVLTELSSIIRALLEPRQYSGVIGLPLEKLRNMLIVLSVTPQVYYGILKSYVPDIFDVSVGRIFREIVLRSETPLWLYDAIIQEKLRAASTPSRLREVERGRLDPLSPLKFEYLSSLYYIIEQSERRMPSPRTLLKYTAKLLDLVFKHGKLDLETFLKFLKEISTEITIVKDILTRLEEIEQTCEDRDVTRTIQLLELVPIPLTESFIIEQAKVSRAVIESLLKTGEVEQVKLLKIKISDRQVLKELNDLRIRRGLEPIDISDDRELSLKIDDYFTRYENEPVLYVVALDNDLLKLAEKRNIKIYNAYMLKRRRVLEHSAETSSIDEIRRQVRKVLTEITDPLKFFEKLTSIMYGRPKICGKIRDGVYFCYTTTSGLGLRTLSIMVELDNSSEINVVKSVLEELLRECYVKYGNDELCFDIISIIVYCPKCELDPNIAEKIIKGPWKVSTLDRSIFTNVHIVDSSNIERYRYSIIGNELITRFKNIPEKYGHYIKYLNDLKEKIDSFLKRSSDYILKNLVLAVRRSRSSKSEILRELVETWIRGEKLLDQPEVWRDSEGRARISNVELLLYQFLKERNICKISQKDLEKIIRRLFPTFLWKDLKEKDLVELCKLRGLLIEVEHGKLAPYTPSIAKSMLARKLEELKKLEKSSKKRIELELGNHKIGIDVQLVSSETSSSMTRIRQLLTDLASLDEGEESLRRFARTMLYILDIEHDLKKEIQNSELILRKIEEFLKKINNSYNTVVQYVRYVESFMPRVARRILKDLDNEVDSILRIVSTYDMINAEELYEYVRRIGEKISLLELEYGKLNDVLRRLSELCDKAREVDATIVNNVNKVIRQIDLKFSKDSAFSIDKIIREIEKIYNNASSRVSSRLVKIYRQAEALRRLVRAVCSAGVYEGDLCLLDLDNVEKIVQVRDKIISELRRLLKDHVEEAIEIAEMGDEISLEDLDENKRRVLEMLCELGIVRRVYRFLS
ncbi:MAG: hypothetical protein GXO10_04875 [Crenarchaeota archaeon]|nr:hypothetical protein [Thermoproteota archaeon]